MAFDPDAYLAAKAPAAGGFDPDAYLASKGVAAAPVDARERARAEALRPPGPRDLTAEEAGTMSPPVSALSATTANNRNQVTGRGPYRYDQPPAPADAPPSDYTIARPTPGGGTHITVTRGNQQEMADPLVQMGTATALGMGAGAGARSLVGAIPKVGASLAPAAGMAVEGGTANKALGGDFTTGAALGLLPLVVPKVADAIGEAIAPSGETLIKDITKGTTKAPAKLRNEVKFRAGEEGSQLTDVLAETPKARRAVAVKAKTDPRGAAADLTDVINVATDGNSADFAAIQRQHGGVPLQPIAEKLAGLEERLNQQGRGVAADAVQRFRTDILKRYGSSPEGLADAKLTAQQIRNMRNDLGTVMDPARAIKPNTKRQAMGKVYDILNREIEDVAADTRGVDVDALRQRNRQISTLIPVRDALAARAESESELGVIARAKKAPANAVRRGIREARELPRALDRLRDEEGGLPGVGSLPSPAEGETAASTAVTRTARTSPENSNSAGTKLSPEQERRYQAWRARLPKELQYEGDYDLRGFFLKNPTFTATSGQHMTDEFKLPNHPTFSNESRYYNDRTKHLGGHWEGDVYIPNDTRFKKRVDESVPTS